MNKNLGDLLKPEFNKSPTAGSRLGTKVSAETKAKISEIFKGIAKSDGHKVKGVMQN